MISQIDHYNSVSAKGIWEGNSMKEPRRQQRKLGWPVHIVCLTLVCFAFAAGEAAAVTALTSSFAWSPVEPPAIGGEVPNFAGNMLGSALANVTGRVTAIAPDPPRTMSSAG
jgi:hypothetical protein